MLPQKYICVAFYITFCFLITGCPAGIKVEILNESKLDIKIIHDYEGDLFSTVEAGTSKVFVQRTDCINIDQAGNVVGYHLGKLPSEYIEGKFNPLVKVIFNPEGLLLVLPVEKVGKNEPLALKPDCDNR